MKKLSFPFAQIIETILDKEEEMLVYATEQMLNIQDALKNMPNFHCPAACNDCCQGSILMSYLEYLHLLTFLQKELGTEKLEAFFSDRLGLMEEDGILLCPFLNKTKQEQHCTLYTHRPLICRVFGTTASPCEEDMEHIPVPEKTFYQLYHKLHYVEDGSFIGLPLTETLALYEAPFAVWAIADSGRTEELLALFYQHGSLRAVICDVPADRFFTMLPGGDRHYLDTP